MNQRITRRERRRKRREHKRLEQKSKRETLQNVEKEKALPPAKRVLPYLRGTFLTTRFAIVVLIGVLSLAGGYALLHPRISVEPSLVLYPRNPYSTQFTVTNESLMFDVHDADFVCWPRQLRTNHNIGIVSFAPLPNLHHVVPRLGPGDSSTVDCPPVMGGIGAWTGQVDEAELEIVATYRQDWWPKRSARYPFKAIKDSNSAVHWIHTTPAEESPFPLPAKQ
jgi:hypothetical protein